MNFAGQFAGFTITESDIGFIFLFFALYIHLPLILIIGVINLVRTRKFKKVIATHTKINGYIFLTFVGLAGVIALFTSDTDISDPRGTVLYDVLVWPVIVLSLISAIALIAEVIYWLVVGILNLVRKKRNIKPDTNVEVVGMPTLPKDEDERK